jgi:hypothetical protein
MSEIKSTLDLVLEKTRHLTLSHEEKKTQQRTEVNRRLKGLLQKYQDNFLKKENLKKELDNLKVAYDLDLDEMLADLLLKSIRLEQDNSLSGLESIFRNFKDAAKSATQERTKQIKTDLSKNRFISGSAVVPNLESDKEWMSMLKHIMDEFDQILNKEKAALAKELSLG